jgi:hypothetical protein
LHCLVHATINRGSNFQGPHIRLETSSEYTKLGINFLKLNSTQTEVSEIIC